MTGSDVTILLQTESGNFFHYCSNKKGETLVNAVINQFSTDRNASYSLKKGGSKMVKKQNNKKKSPMDDFVEKHQHDLNTQQPVVSLNDNNSDKHKNKSNTKKRDLTISDKCARPSINHRASPLQNWIDPPISLHNNNAYLHEAAVASAGMVPSFATPLQYFPSEVFYGHSELGIVQSLGGQLQPLCNETMLQLANYQNPTQSHYYTSLLEASQPQPETVSLNSASSMPSVEQHPFFLNQKTLNMFRSSMTNASPSFNPSSVQQEDATKNASLDSFTDPALEEQIRGTGKRKREQMTSTSDSAAPENPQKRRHLSFLEEDDESFHKVNPPMLFPCDVFGSHTHPATLQMNPFEDISGHQTWNLHAEEYPRSP